MTTCAGEVGGAKRISLLDQGPRACPKYQSCSAGICPLDPSWRRSHHLAGEPVCKYLLASGKAGAADHYQGDPVFPVAAGLVDEIARQFPSISREVARASRSGFRGAHLRRKTA
jgi:hypothetical protein